MEIKSRFSYFILFGFISICNTKQGDEQLDRTTILSSPESVLMVHGGVYFDSQEELLCSLHSLLGAFQLCSKKGHWRGFWIKDTTQLPTLAILIESSDGDDALQELPTFYTPHTDSFFTHFTTPTPSINTVVVGQQTASEHRSTLVVDTQNLIGHSLNKMVHLGDLGADIASDLPRLKSDPISAASVVVKNLPKIEAALQVPHKSHCLVYIKDAQRSFSSSALLHNLRNSNITKNAVIMLHQRTRVYRWQLLEKLVPSYTEGACFLHSRQEVKCFDNLTKVRRRNLCTLQTASINFGTICLPEDNKLHTLQDRSVSSGPNKHNLATWAEYTSDYASTFNLCFFSFLIYVVIVICGITVMVSIDATSFSILTRDSGQKLKED